MKRIKRLAIANRGEVAVRIHLACEELGIESVLLHSEADRGTRAYRMCHKKICIGPASIAESYLNIEANLQGALGGGADAIHPGFGFLSENANFAEACEKAGLLFVGPPVSAIRLLGDKIQCKELAKQLQVPLVPGYDGANQDIGFLCEQAERIGFPVIAKAAAGGGGRGMKLIYTRAEAPELLESAQRESMAAFGSSQVFIEKYLDHAKHIEFQVFGDSTGQVVHYFDRECSVQRRHQKIVEEALSPSLTDELRKEMGEAAVAMAQAAKYKSAGTVEFLLQDNKYYLMEVNTRLQVEHPVTELVMGVDLVKAQILTAQGDFIIPPQNVRVPKGSSIECRLYAENSYLGGVPSPGLLGEVRFPEGPGRRFEYGFERGDTITSFYDPMIAKVIVWDETRPRAIQKMLRVLQDTVIFGVHTNIPYLLKILSHPEFVTGRMTTRFIETHLSGALAQDPLTELEIQAHQACWTAIGKLQKQQTQNERRLHGSAQGASSAYEYSPWSSHWRSI